MTGSSPSPDDNGRTGSAGLSSARRKLIYGAMAGAAVAAGIGLFRWRDQTDAAPPANLPTLWDLSFDTLGPKPLVMRSMAGKPVLLNFWATWCPPCVEELPLLSRFYEENRRNGWQVLGLAVDQPAPVEAFLRRTPVGFPVALAGMSGIELSRTLGNIAGGLPFTVIFGSSGQVLHRKMGRVTTLELQQWSALK